MITTTMRSILKNETGTMITHRVYIIYGFGGKKVLYVGRSRCAVSRIIEHWYSGTSLSNYLGDNAPESFGWQVGLLDANDCIKLSQYYNVECAVEDVESFLIYELHPSFNVQGNNKIVERDAEQPILEDVLSIARTV